MEAALVRSHGNAIYLSKLEAWAAGFHSDRKHCTFNMWVLLQRAGMLLCGLLVHRGMSACSHLLSINSMKGTASANPTHSWHWPMVPSKLLSQYAHHHVLAPTYCTRTLVLHHDAS